jgi:hypothetical protein
MLNDSVVSMKAVLLDRDGVINALVYYQGAGVLDGPFRTLAIQAFSARPGCHPIVERSLIACSQLSPISSGSSKGT